MKWMLAGFMYLLMSVSLFAAETIDPNTDYIQDRDKLFVTSNWSARVQNVESRINRATPKMEDYQNSPLGKRSERLSTRLVNLRSVGQALSSQVRSKEERLKVSGEFLIEQAQFQKNLEQLEKDVTAFERAAALQKKAGQLIESDQSE